MQIPEKIIKKAKGIKNLKSQFNHLAESLNEEVDGFKDEINQLVASGKSKFEQGKKLWQTTLRMKSIKNYIS